MCQKTIPVSAQSLFKCDVNEKGSLNKCFCCLQTGYQEFSKSVTVNEKRGVDVLPAMDALPHSTGHPNLGKYKNKYIASLFCFLDPPLAIISAQNGLV